MIESSTALEIARARAAENGWAFGEPVAVLYRRKWFVAGGRYLIESNAAARGTKARFVIDAESGAILSEGYVPR